MKLQFGQLIIQDKEVARLEELGYTPETLKMDVGYHKSSLTGEPSVYCGTYAKYNDGNLCGLWLDLSTFNGYDEFINFCKALHADEDDPELMFQDYEGFPSEWYSESCFDEETFNNIKEYSELCNKHSKEAVDAFMGWGCEELEHFDDCYMGEYKSEEDYAQELIDECYDLDRLMGNLACYFDYAAFARDLFMSDYYFDDGFVFRRY